MKIEHLAIWVDDLETMKAFYLKYFDTNSGEKYTNEKNQYTAYFIYFGEDKTRLELMNKPNIAPCYWTKRIYKRDCSFYNFSWWQRKSK